MSAVLVAFPFTTNARAGSSVENREGSTPQLTAEQTAAYAKRIEAWSKILKECRQGERSDSDKFFALRGILMDYGRLGMRGSPGAKTALQEYRTLIREHPELLAHPPQQLSDVKRRRDKERAEARAVANGPIHPADSEPMVAYQDANDTAVLYQYHIDFYRVQPGSTVRIVGDSGPAFEHPKLFRKGESFAGGALKPVKTISFQHPFSNAPFVLKQGQVKNDFWVCTNFLVNYSPATPAERRIILAKYHSYVMPWTNTKGQVADFCGALSLTGKILYQLPIKQHDPDSLLDLRMVSDDGAHALIYLGKRGSLDEGGDATPAVVDDREILIWEAPDKLIHIDPAPLTDSEILKTLKSYGFHGVQATWHGRFDP